MSMVQPAGRDLGGEPTPLGGRFYDPMHSTGIERPALAGHEHGRIRRGLTESMRRRKFRVAATASSGFALYHAL